MNLRSVSVHEWDHIKVVHFEAMLSMLVIHTSGIVQHYLMVPFLFVPGRGQTWRVSEVALRMLRFPRRHLVNVSHDHKTRS